jgi:hypothetical protein
MKWEKDLEERWLVGCGRAEQPFKNGVSRKRLSSDTVSLPVISVSILVIVSFSPFPA